MNRALVVVLAAIFGIAAIGCGSSKPAALTVITVSGVVTTAAGPVASAKVKINDRPVVTTASDGIFTVSDVTVPYSALIGDPATNSAVLYLGLTRSEPDLNFGNIGVVPPVRTGTITGKVLGSPFPSNSLTSVAFGSVDFNVPLSDNWVLADSTGNYTKEVKWRGSSPLNGTVHALQWSYDPATLKPTTFTGHGNTATRVAVSEGLTLNVSALSLTALSSDKSITGQVSVPSGYVHNSRWHEIYLEPDNTRFPVFIETSTLPTSLPLNFSYVVPTLAGSTAAVWVNAAVETDATVYSQVRRCGIIPGSSGVALDVPLPPKPDQPDDSATGVGVGTPFLWTAFPSGGGIHGVLISTTAMLGTGEVTSLLVYTAGTQVPLPNLAPVGLAWPAAISYTWLVAGYAPVTIDGWADPIIQIGCDFTTGFSAKRTFTTP